MKKISFVVIIVFSFVLAGCNDIIDAISGINSKANEAAEAIGEDVHTLRSTPIEMNSRQTITINDFIKAILRDVQWKHEKKDQIELLSVNGTWKDGLFEDYQFEKEEKEVLKENGDVEIQLFFKQKQIQDDLTTVILKNGDYVIVNLTGEEALKSLKDAYNNR